MNSGGDGGEGMERTGSDAVWDLVSSFNQYDSMAILAAVPALRQRFFSPLEHAGVAARQTHEAGSSVLAPSGLQIIRNARIKNVGKSQSCMVSKLPI